MSTHDVFAPRNQALAAARQDAAAAADQRRQRIRDAFSSGPAAIAFLRDCLATANAAPGFVPGWCAQQTAYNAGRRDALREVVATIDDAFHPRQPAPTRNGD